MFTAWRRLSNFTLMKQRRKLSKMSPKEKEVVERLRSAGIRGFRWNRALRNRLRPDLMFRLRNRVVILEIDEHEHRYRVPKEEIMRLRKIQQSLNVPVDFLRYNPDAKNPYLGSHMIRRLSMLLKRAPKQRSQNISVEYLGYSESRKALLKHATLSCASR